MSHGPLKRFMNTIEPLIWGPFVTGNFLTPLVFPALVLAVGVLQAAGRGGAVAASAAGASGVRCHRRKRP